MVIIALICLIPFLLVVLIMLLLIYFSGPVADFSKLTLVSDQISIVTGGGENPFDSCKVSQSRYISVKSLTRNDLYVLAINDSRIIRQPELRVMFWKTKNGMQCFEVIYPEIDAKGASPNELIDNQKEKDKSKTHAIPIITDILKYNDEDVKYKRFDERMLLLKKACSDIEMVCPKYILFNHRKNYGDQFKKIMLSSMNRDSSEASDSDSIDIKCMIFKSNEKPYFHYTSTQKWIDKKLLEIYINVTASDASDNFDFASDEFSVGYLMSEIKGKGLYRIYVDGSDLMSPVKIEKVCNSSLDASEYSYPRRNYKENMNIWREMNKGLIKDSFLGNTLHVLKALHRTAAENNLYRHLEDNKTVLDMGAGRGNYFWMWKRKNLDVYAVEPDNINYKLLLNKKKMYDFKSLQAYGQEDDKILKFMDGQKVDYITFIYTLTFFFENDKTLDNLVKLIDKTLKKGGLLLGQVMDGKRLLASTSDKSIYSEVDEAESATRGKSKKKKTLKRKETKEPTSTKEISTTSKSEIIKKVGIYDCAPYMIKVYPSIGKNTGLLGKKVFINIDDPITLVKNQWEYVVDFETFAHKLKSVDIILQNTGFLDEESELLNKCPKWFTKLGRYFVFKKI